GRPQRVDPEVQRGLLEALGYPAQSPQQIEQSLAALARLREDSANLGLLVGECGQPLEQALGPAGTPGELVYEDGTRIALRLDTEGRLPAQARSGYAQLSLEQREWAVAMAPPSCPSLASLAPGRSRRWGLAAQVYALRRPGDGGLGDSAALEDLLRSAARHGADALAISPLHALAEANGHAYSPYSPSSRLFFNVLHAAPATILGAAAVEQAIRRAGLAAEMARLESLELIDWTAAADLRMRLLRQLHRDFTERASPLRHDLAEFRREAGEALLHHCRFETLQAHLGAGPDWRRWPEPLRRPGEPAVAAFCADHAEEVDFRAFGQWLTQRCLQHAQRQAREAGMAIGLVADLAVGADGGGSQAWSRQEELLAEVNVGAPPDILNQSGQDWGVSAFNPEGLRRHGYRAFREMLRANLAWPGG
ncbi:TPA: 4-alpha-glucanotransferase, partial [Pseudomonas aeruginosa]|nr:4-alpha-glucanotransferase [Pseudomonas aeruginosa]